jgi:hypothetical protein
MTGRCKQVLLSAKKIVQNWLTVSFLKIKLERKLLSNSSALEITYNNFPDHQCLLTLNSHVKYITKRAKLGNRNVLGIKFRSGYSNYNESTWDESTWDESTWDESTWDESTWDESTWDESTWNRSNLPKIRLCTDLYLDRGACKTP